MPLVPMTELLEAAQRGGYAVGYFEAWDTYSIEAVLEAAEIESAPVILGFGCLLVDQMWLERGGIEILGEAGRAVASRSRVPVALLLNEVHTLEQARRGIDAGFNAVMLHTDDEHAVADLVRIAHARGVTVEGELGTLPDGDAVGEIDMSHATLTQPHRASAYVAATGVDCLAVSFGNVHTLENGMADVDLALLGSIRDEVDLPLVVHGGTGFPSGSIRGAIEGGAAKFNVGTALKRGYLQELGTTLTTIPPTASPHDLVGSHGSSDFQAVAMRSVVGIVRALIHAYGASGREESHR